MELAPRASLRRPPRLASHALEAPEKTGDYVVPGAGLLAVFGVLALFGLLTPNPFLTAAAVLVLPAFMALLWRRGEPPVLLFAVGFQWLQVTARVFQANTLGVTVTELAEKEGIYQVILLSLFGLLVLAVGMRLALRRLGPTRAAAAAGEMEHVLPMRAFWFYVAATLVSMVAREFAWSMGGLTQVFFTLTGVRWIGLFLFGYAALYQKRLYPLLLAAIAFEVISGIGFFSAFKEPIFIALIVFGTVRHEVRPGTVITGLAVVVLLFFMGSAWTAVKGEYRAFLQQGSVEQGTSLSQGEQVSALSDRLLALSFTDVLEASDPLFARLGYVEYFASVREYVPAVRPHEGGALWMQSVMHVLTPRLLFPSKPSLPSDSELTMAYTGFQLASDVEGTSISIGYMGESYIDFGPYGMFVPIFLLGCMWGLIYVWFVGRARITIIGFAFAAAMLVDAYQFEMAGIKVFGGTITRFIVFAALMYVLQGPLWRWITGGRGEVETQEEGALAHVEA